MCSGSEADSYLRLIDSCITQLKAQGPSRTCNESKEEEELFGVLNLFANFMPALVAVIKKVQTPMARGRST